MLQKQVPTTDQKERNNYIFQNLEIISIDDHITKITPWTVEIGEWGQFHKGLTTWQHNYLFKKEIMIIWFPNNQISPKIITTLFLLSYAIRHINPYCSSCVFSLSFPFYDVAKMVEALSIYKYVKYFDVAWMVHLIADMSNTSLLDHLKTFTI